MDRLKLFKLLKHCYHRYGKKAIYVAKTPDSKNRICCIHHKKDNVMVEDIETGRICIEYTLIDSNVESDEYCFNTIEILGVVKNIK